MSLLTGTSRTVSSTRLLRLPDSGDLNELLRGCPVGFVYSNPERRHCQRRSDLTGWGGRLAAKLAVADLLGVDGEAALDQGLDIGLVEIEILPDRAQCPEGAGCLEPHPPRVRLGDRFCALLGGDRCRVSISHTRARAVALAVRTVERSVAQP